MELTAIVPRQSGGKFLFLTVFDDGTEVTVSATELQTFKKFQRRVLVATGKLFTPEWMDFSPYPRQVAERWQWELEDLLKEQRTGQGKVA
jgi:hypothetical protein